MAELLTTGQAARALGVSHTTVRDAIKSGALRCHSRTRGGHARLTAAEVERFRRGPRRGPTCVAAPASSYRAILDAFSAAMIAADDSGSIAYANPAAEALLGWPAGTLNGRPLSVIIPANLRGAHASAFSRYLSTGITRMMGQTMRVPVQRRDGTQVAIELSISVLGIDDGTHLFIASLRDLRERVELERQLMATQYLRATTRVAAQLTSHLDLDHVLKTVVEALVDDFDAALARIWQYDHATATLHLRANSGSATPPAVTASGRVDDVDTASILLASAAREGRAFVSNRLADYSYFDPAWIEREGIAAVAALPLLIGTRIYGVLSYFSRREITDEMMEALSTFTVIVAAAMSDAETLARAQAARADAEAQARRLSLVQQTARELVVITSVQDLYERLLETIHQRMGRHIAGVYMVGKGELSLAACRVPSTDSIEHVIHLPLGTGIMGHVATTGQAYLCGDTGSDPYFFGLDSSGTRAEIAAPIRTNEGVIGVINVESTCLNAFDDGDLATLIAIADQAAIAIQNARLYTAEAELRQRAETRARRIEHVQRVGERLKMDLDEREVGLRVVEAAREALGFRMAVLNLGDRPGDPQTRARVVATAGLPPEGEAALRAHDYPLAEVEKLFRPEYRLSRSYFIPAEVTPVSVQTEIPVWTPQIVNSGADAWHAGDELLVPLTDRQDGHLLGFLSVDDPESGQRPEREEVEVLEIFADQAVVALRNTRLLAEARRQAERDPVTGLLNHRAAHARLDAELAVAREAARPLGLLTLDMDDFKLINDTYGHPAGDLALRHVAALLERCARASDTAARLGGDEFVLILPGATRQQSIEVAQRLSALAQETSLDIDGAGHLPLRLSVGVAAYPHDAEQPHALFAIADARLYEAKRAGGRAVEAGRDPQEGDREKVNDLAGFDMLSALVTAVDNKDRYTSEHSEQVASFACALADALGLSPETQRTLRLAGLLHDVGKIGVPDRVLRKPGALEPDEWEAMKQHVSLSAALVRAIVPDPDILAAVAHHHERWDGTGYPHGLAGTQIPLLGRIMIVADAVSAMAMNRPYRRGLGRAVIASELRKGAGTQFDPALVEPFIALFDALYEAVA